MIFTTCNLRNLLTVLLYYVRNILIVWVACLAVCEELVRVLCSTTCNRTLRSQGAVTEVLNELLWSDSLDVLHVHQLYLMILVRGTEAIEEVDEWYLCLESSEMRYSSQVHYLLHRSRSEHSETCLTASHNILMVTKDTQSVRSQCTSRYIEYAREQLTSNLIHVRNHEQQTL